MYGRFPSHHEPSDFDDDGTWNEPFTVVLWGGVVPVLIFGWVLYDLWAGGTWVPSRHAVATGFWFSFADDFYVALGLVMFKASVAAGLCVYFVVGNHAEWGWHRDKLMLPLIVTAVLSLLLSVAGVWI